MTNFILSWSGKEESEIISIAFPFVRSIAKHDLWRAFKGIIEPPWMRGKKLATQY